MDNSLFSFEPLNLLPDHGQAIYFPHFFTREESDRYFENLQQSIPWQQEPVKIFGKPVMQPRLTAWYGDDGKTYTYSGITMEPYGWTPALQEIKQKAEQAAGHTFSSALLNFYRDGQDSMGWHRDNEKQLGENPVIASVSFGAGRIFKLRPYINKTPVRSIELTHGSLLVMSGETQHYWEHAVPKTAKMPGPRINITFRKILY